MRDHGEGVLAAFAVAVALWGALAAWYVGSSLSTTAGQLLNAAGLR